MNFGGLHELTSGGATYDNNGNYGANGSGKTYDGWNRLVGISQSGYNYGTLRYNGLHQLVSQVTDFPYYNHSNDQYYYGVEGRLLEERAWDGYQHACKKHFVWGTNALDDLVVTWQASTNAYEFSVQDASWKVVAITNGTSSIKERYRYTPYGVPTKVTADWAGTGTIYDDIPLYTGQRYNWLNGVWNFKKRYYDSGAGRFMQRDPLGHAHDYANYLNAYSYVGNDPGNGIDPLGLYEIDVHYYLTKFICEATKCFKGGECEAVAQCDQGADEWETTRPGLESFDSMKRRELYHFTDASRRNKMKGKASKNCDPCMLGLYMHAVQDQWSHKGYGTTIGHITAGHSVDKTANDANKAITMAKLTLKELCYYAQKCNCCKCDPSVIWPQVEGAVNQFVRLSGGDDAREINEGEVKDKAKALGMEPGRDAGMLPDNPPLGEGVPDSPRNLPHGNVRDWSM